MNSLLIKQKIIAKAKNKKSKKNLVLHIKNSQNVHCLINLLFPYYLRILKIEKHGLIYFVKIKTDQLKIVWLALSDSLKSLNKFKINFEKNFKNETGIAIDLTDFDLKVKLKNKDGMFSSIKNIGEIHMFLLALNTSHRIVDKIKILSVPPKKIR